MRLERVPDATYRLQLRPDFNLNDVIQILSYLEALGVSTLYLSPILQAQSGSTHGYDVCDPTRVSEDLGGEAAFVALADAAAERGLTLLLDFVPNHMSAHHENRWWWEVLAEGREAETARYFDIDWTPARESLHGRILLPILGQSLEEAIEAGELQIDRGVEPPVIRYNDMVFPISGEAGGDIAEVLGRQHYQLAYWPVGNEEINYRRFFDITGLVALRQEDPAVFNATHVKLLEMAQHDAVIGIRLDHIDGLYDPRAYFEQLQQALSDSVGEPAYVVAEKILEAGFETMPAGWQIAGSTGYDSLSMTTMLFIDEDNSDALRALYQRVTGDERNFGQLVRQQKHRMMEELFAVDLERLTDLFTQLADRTMAGRDLSRAEIAMALAEITAVLPIYRTYLDDGPIVDSDRRRVLKAYEEAIDRRPELQRALDVLKELILDEVELDQDGAALRRDALARWQQLASADHAKGLEDTSLYIDTRLVSANTVGGGPSMMDVDREKFHDWARGRAEHFPGTMNASSTHDTKRSEDVRSRISVLSELVDEWDARFQRWWGMVESARTVVNGEQQPDGRMGLLFFQTLLGIWPLETPNVDELRERMSEYLIKSAREAKLETSWVRVDGDYEQALTSFSNSVIDPEAWPQLYADFLPFAQRIARLGAMGSLSLTLLKSTITGVPDFYQGTELWNLRLVDPDNRRPVDFSVPERMLQEIDQQSPLFSELVDQWETGVVKLELTRRLLNFRRRESKLFQHGSYLPLEVDGPLQRHIVAFSREHDRRRLIVIVPRFFAEIDTDAPDSWRGNAVVLPAGWHGEAQNVVTGEPVEIAGSRIELAAIAAPHPWGCLLFDTAE